MAWNTVRHLEAWYGIPGAGCVTLSLNPRLFDGQLEYIVNHAGARWILLDADLLPVAERLADRWPGVKGYILIDADPGEDRKLGEILHFETLIADAANDGGWFETSELDPAGLCYTSGTTGSPKGVLYTHRSHVLHAMAVLQPDALGLSCNDRVLPVVPFFHANAWSTPFSAAMAGSGMLLPGRDLSPPGLHEMILRGATVTLAVPSVWHPYLRWLGETGETVPDLQRAIIGGSACPESMIREFRDRHGVHVIHAWGMTEMSPLGSFNNRRPEYADMTPGERLEAESRCGQPFFSVEFDLRDSQGAPVPWDGVSTGHLRTRGPAVVQRYFGAGEEAVDPDGWFDTGDICSISRHSNMRVADRAKDLIKSGGEWISSIDLENIAVEHPDIAEAAAVAKPDERWGERPVLFVLPAAGATQDADAIRRWLRQRLVRWQVPDDIRFLSEIPHTATGKIAKNRLRDRLAET